jgi:hypothetical protein
MRCSRHITPLEVHLSGQKISRAISVNFYDLPILQGLVDSPLLVGLSPTSETFYIQL